MIALFDYDKAIHEAHESAASLPACPVSDETCLACAYCEGSLYIPTTIDDCECAGTGCANRAHREGE